MSEQNLSRRIAFVVSSHAGEELAAGKFDAASMYSILTDSNLGACNLKISPHLPECKNIGQFNDSIWELLKEWRSEDQLIFYFSGHGKIIRETYCIKLGLGERDYLILDNFLTELHVRGVKKAILILDACHSGAAATGIKKDNNEELESEVKKIESEVKKLEETLPRGIAIIASSGASQVSQEMSDRSGSVFTRLLCDGIRNGIGEHATIDGYIGIDDIVVFVQKELEKTKYRQRPVYSIKGADSNIWISRNISRQPSIVNISETMTQKIVSSDELKILYEKTIHQEHPCGGAKITDLDWALVTDYCRNYSLENVSKYSPEQLLAELRFYSEIPILGKLTLHKSAVLCFAFHPEKFYPQAEAVFILSRQGDLQSSPQTIRGPLSRQIKTLFELIKENLTKISVIGNDGSRKEIYDIELDLVRELISNAIVHRNYELNARVTVRLTPERLDIQSPGEFPGDTSWEEFIKAESPISSPVNVRIAHYLIHLLFAESVGRGFGIIKRYLEEKGSGNVNFRMLTGPTILVSVLRLPFAKEKASLQVLTNQIFQRIENSEQQELLPIIETWLDRFEQVSQELKDDVDIQKNLHRTNYRISQRFFEHAKNQILKLSDATSVENKILSGLLLLRDDLGPKDEVWRLLSDLNVIANCLKGSEPTIVHKFIDIELAGFYANLRWPKYSARALVSEELEYSRILLQDNHDVFTDIFRGIFKCEQLFPALTNTLLQDLGKYYVTSLSSETSVPDYLWWHELLRMIDIVEHSESEIAQWCQEKSEEKARYVYNQHLIDSGLSPRRVLWPLELPNRIGIISDSNYDFPLTVDQIDDIATLALYSLNTSTVAKTISAFDVCQTYLSYPNHCIVAGAQKAGKSWLRLYLEYFSFNIGERLLPLFYFASVSLAYQSTVIDVVKNLARSVANQLFADLLVRSGYRTPMNDPLRASRVAILPFLQHYGYTLPLGDDSLAQPIPPKHILDIQLAYEKSYLGTVYAQMKQGIDALPATMQTPLTVEEMLDDIQRAIELTGYQQIFVLVDNWEDLPAVPRQRLLQQLLQPDLLQQLSRHGIFLKLFMPAMANSTLACFEETCEIERESSPKLTLYTYRDPNAEPESV